MSIKRLGPYRLDKVLGRGGMGTVYAAVDDTTGETVAVKVLAESYSGEEHFRNRFVTEVETMKKLDHPNIVRILAHGEEHGQLYFSMEFVNGPSLFDVLKRGKRYDWREVARIGIDTCLALNHAHASGVIHRDLKPGNLLIDQDQNVKLTDFGIAKLYGGMQLTRDGGVLGTADYMSPEQAQGKPVTVRSDIYSLGSVLYALLARRPPFQSTSLAQTIKNVSFEKPTSILNHAPNTPPEFAQLIERLLEKEPEKRIATARSVANRLQALLDELKEGRTVADDEHNDFAVSRQTTDPNRTAIPETIVTANPTAAFPPAEKPGEPLSSRKTAIDPTLIRTRSESEVIPAQLATPDLIEPPSSSFTVVDEAERKRAQTIEHDEVERGSIWLYLVGLMIVVGLGIGGIVYSNMPKSADSLLNQIDEAKNRGDDQLAVVLKPMKEFDQRYPDHARHTEIVGYIAYVERSVTSRRIRQQLRLHGFSSMSPPEQHYADALKLADADPEAAALEFEDLITIYGSLPGFPDAAHCVEGAREELEQLSIAIKKHQEENRGMILSALARAEKLNKEEAAKLLLAIIHRYEDREWAKDLTIDARRMLDTLVQE